LFSPGFYNKLNLPYLYFKLSRLQQLLNHIKTLAPISEIMQNALYNSFERKELPRLSFLLNEGQQCRHLYFLEKGAVRGFYNSDGREITHWFAFENDFVTSFHSFITHTPAVENIQLTESCVLWSITKEALAKLLNEHHETERLLRIAYEKYYIRLEERFVNAQFKTASERYNDLLLQSPHILERMPLGAIASYLGISQETLSRIRSRF
jgi:CRP-like cAMP-binding protein